MYFMPCNNSIETAKKNKKLLSHLVDFLKYFNGFHYLNKVMYRFRYN